MIIRQILIRQGRNAALRTSYRSSRKWQSTETTSSGTQDYNDAPFLQSNRNESQAQIVSGVSSEDTKRKQKPKSALQVAEEYTEYQRQKALAKNMGGVKTPTYSPHTSVNNPPSPSHITLELLLASQSHMGHATSRWNPANSQYIFGVRDGTHIISLDVTTAHLRRACKVVNAVTAKGGLVLFIGTREGQERSVVKAAELSGGYHLFDRWVPGSLTNSTQILGRCRLKVVNEFDEEVPGFASQVDALPPMKPDLVVVLNPLENRALLLECAQNDIPTVGIIDTDADPLQVTYPIPANDDSLRCTNLIAGVLGRAGEEGRNYRLDQASKGKVLARADTRLQRPGRSRR